MRLAPPWQPIAVDDERERLESELRREMPIEHPLATTSARAIALRRDRDDVLFALGSGAWAIVHLTWKQETESEWPATAVYETEAEVDARLRSDESDFPDHEAG